MSQAADGHPGDAPLPPRARVGAGGSRPGPWRHDERTATASALHAGWPEVDAAPGERAVARCRPTGSAVVLGSTQAETDVDAARAAAAGVAVARRRSGGGLVLVDPGDPLWLDVWVPASDPLWEPDVLVSFDWLGLVWARALGSVGLEVDVHRGRLQDPGGWGRHLCFGAVGAGEVVTGECGGRVCKVVGLSQRRTRAGSWFHGACPLGADPGRLTGVLAGSEAIRQRAARWLGATAPGLAALLGTDEDVRSLGDRLAASFVAALP